MLYTALLLATTYARSILTTISFNGTAIYNNRASIAVFTSTDASSIIRIWRHSATSRNCATMNDQCTHVSILQSTTNSSKEFFSLWFIFHESLIIPRIIRITYRFSLDFTRPQFLTIDI